MGEKSIFRRLFHWGPITAMSIIACVTVSTLYCHLQWWPIEQSVWGLLDAVLFLALSSQCLANLLRAAIVGPGYVPLKWRPGDWEAEEKLQYCRACYGFKAPRSHHCKKCDRCIMKMDHHCPWINNCCGHFNHAYFIKFLFYAVAGCFHATIILACSIYYALYRVWFFYHGSGNEPIVELGLAGLFFSILGIGMAAGVVVAVGFLLVTQIRSVARNKSAIEEYIVAKARHRHRDDDFIYPYDLGWKENLLLVLFGEQGDGYTWPIVDGCDQYTFTIEQLMQKELKRELVRRYIAVKAYDGSKFFACFQWGCRIHCCQPLVDETRLSLKVGDHVLVTRWRRHWLYGERRPLTRSGVGGLPYERGWFPRRCVVEPVEEEEEQPISDEIVGETDTAVHGGNDDDDQFSRDPSSRSTVNANGHFNKID